MSTGKQGDARVKYKTEDTGGAWAMVFAYITNKNELCYIGSLYITFFWDHGIFLGGWGEYGKFEKKEN